MSVLGVNLMKAPLGEGLAGAFLILSADHDGVAVSHGKTSAL